MGEEMVSAEAATPVELWVAALRSGEYKQGEGRLHSADGEFCCLGVACMLAQKAGVVPAPVEDEDGDWEYGTGEDTSAAFLPDVVRRWLGLTTCHGFITDGSGLATRNDNGSTFVQIADVIEARPAGLFMESGNA